MLKKVELLSDGTLVVNTNKYDKVKRVLIEYGTNGTLYYSDNTDWIPVSLGFPEDITPVIVTYKNNNPASYYKGIKGKLFTGTAHYLNGKWYWYSDTTKYILAEYGKCDSYEFHPAIEVVAWQSLPIPYKGENNDERRG